MRMTEKNNALSVLTMMMFMPAVKVATMVMTTPLTIVVAVGVVVRVRADRLEDLASQRTCASRCSATKGEHGVVSAGA